MPTPAIALATRDDVPHALRFANWAADHTAANFALAHEPLEDWLLEYDHHHATHPWLVARVDDAVVGFVKASPYRLRAAYAWTAEVTVYVDAASHGHGIGRALYGALLPLLRTQGFVTLLAGITVPNPASVRLHESFGFTRCATFTRAGWKFGCWHDVGFWELHLTDGTDGAAPRRLRPALDAWGARTG